MASVNFSVFFPPKTCRPTGLKNRRVLLKQKENMSVGTQKQLYLQRIRVFLASQHAQKSFSGKKRGISLWLKHSFLSL